MKLLQNFLIRGKLISIILIVTILSLGIGFTLDIYYSIRTFKEALVKQSMLNAKMVGEYCVAALEFHDNPAASQMLAKLQNIPDVKFCCLYDTDGNKFATYGKADVSVPLHGQADTQVYALYKEDFLYVFQQIEYQGRKFGTIYLLISTELLDKQIRHRFRQMLLIMVGIILIAIIAARQLQKTISGPILKLVGVTNLISKEANYSVRIQKKSNDEIGSLYDGFNNMVEQIRIRQEELAKHREHLEELVEKRTRELQDAQEELVRKEKLAILGQLSGGVAHELRNPLGAIKNAAYFLNMAVEEPETDVKETLEMLENDVGRCEKIIGNLLDYARPKPPAKQKLDINEVIKKALSHTTLPENIEVVNQPGKKIPDILADPGQLEQAFGNIILNCIQAMQEGGQLVIKSEVTDPGWIAVSVSDTGVGIPKDDIKKIFEPLFTTKAKGIGLGLALTKTLVAGNGGTIEIKSEAGKGSTFIIKLPVSKKGGIKT